MLAKTTKISFDQLYLYNCISLSDLCERLVREKKTFTISDLGTLRNYNKKLMRTLQFNTQSTCTFQLPSFMLLCTLSVRGFFFFLFLVREWSQEGEKKAKVPSSPPPKSSLCCERKTKILWNPGQTGWAQLYLGVHLNPVEKVKPVL